MNVLIAGGGISGLAAARALHKAGHRIKVHERGRATTETGSGLVLSPNGIRALERIDGDAGRRVREHALTGVHAPFPFLTPAGSVKAYGPDQGLAATWGAPLVTIRRSMLHWILRETLPNGVVETERRLTDISEDADGVTVGFADGSVERAELLLGTDGLRSVVRGHVAPGASPRYLGMTSVRGISPAPIEPYPAGFLTQGPGLQIFAPRMCDGQLYWAATLNKPEGAWPRLDHEDVRNQLAQRVQHWHTPVPAIVARTPPDELVITDIYDMAPLPRWSTARVTLLGDAAHPMSPAMGQGANTALEDAAVLSRVLDAHTRDPRNLAAALEAYEVTRRDRTTRMARLSRQVGAIGQWESRLATALRDTGMRLFMRSGRTSNTSNNQDAWLYGYEPEP